MRVIEVVPEMASLASGLTGSVCAMSRALAPHCSSIQLHLLAPVIPSDSTIDLRIHQRLNLATRLGISPAMARALRDAAPVTDIMHTHSLWMMPSIYPAQASNVPPVCLSPPLTVHFRRRRCGRCRPVPCRR